MLNSQDFYSPDEDPSQSELQARKTAQAWQTAESLGGGAGAIGGTALGLIPGLEPFAPALGKAGQLVGEGIPAVGQMLFGGPDAAQLTAERQKRLHEYEGQVAQDQNQAANQLEALKIAIQAAHGG